MQSNLGRAALGAAAAIAAVVLLIMLSKGSDDDEPNGGGTAVTTERTDSGAGDGKPAGDGGPDEPAIPTILVRNGKPVGGVEELRYEAGERIRFRVRSDTTDEIHVHGYDVEEEVAAGGSVLFDFPATLEGIYEAELHGSGEQIAELRVEP